MWNRKELKGKAKVRFRVNYWKSVLVALILMALIGGGSASSVSSIFENDEEETVLVQDNETGESKSTVVTVNEVKDEIDRVLDNEVEVAVFIILVVMVIIIVCIIAIPLQILVFNPLEIGCKRFFLKNLKEDALTREICYAFDNGYKNNIKVMFLRDLYTILWTLLFIIPGIVKAYEYLMVPYILAEHPGIDRKEAFALSKKMMYGNKWRAFLMDLSFLGWMLLDVLTLGILGVFYVNPYMMQTEAALYEAVKNVESVEN